MYVFIYYTNNTRFCLGYYDFDSELWIDSDGMVINSDFLWCYLPVKQMKCYIQNMSNGNMKTRKFNIDGVAYKMFNLEIFDKRINVASNELHLRVNDLIALGRYEEVRHIDSMYGYYLPEDIDDTNPESVRESIECVYEE